MKLYEIDQQILECMDSDTGEVVDIDRLERLSIDRENKLESIALYIKNLNAEAEAIKSEEKSLAERRKSKERKADRLKDFLSYNLGGKPFETAKVKLSFRRSTAVDITNHEELLRYLEDNEMKSCIKYQEPDISKKKVGELLKTGQEIPGAKLVYNTNMEVK